jgi:mannose-6-phosphate isomerase-like protein (cupin superfamily)
VLGRLWQTQIHAEHDEHGSCAASATRGVPAQHRTLSGATVMDITNIDCVPAFITKDGSEIRELLAQRNSSIRNQSLAEARLPPGAATTPHHHPRTEEIYYILEGHGVMQLGDESRPVGPGDAIAIPPGARHQIRNTAPTVLKFLCCCAPGYEDDDTVLGDVG